MSSSPRRRLAACTQEHGAAPLRANPLTFFFLSLFAEIPSPSPRTLLRGKLEGAGKHRQRGHLLADLVCLSWKARVNSLAGGRLAVFLEASMANTCEPTRRNKPLLLGFGEIPRKSV